MSDIGDMFTLVPSTTRVRASIGARYAGDIVLPVRFVHNVRSGRLVVRCVGTMSGVRGCMEEWDLPPHGEDVTLAHAISAMLGHVQTEHDL